MKRNTATLAGGVIVLSGALWLSAAGMAQAADVSGTVLLPNGRPARNAVVALEGDARVEPLAKAVVDQRDKVFLPHISVITVGTTVEFPNNDTVFHNVFTYYNSDRFDLGMYPRGATKRVTFKKKGVVSLLCNVHSEMNAYIVVVDTPLYAITDRDGRFRIAGAGTGAYTARVWHESGAGAAQTLAVKAEGAAVTLSLSKKK